MSKEEIKIVKETEFLNNFLETNVGKAGMQGILLIRSLSMKLQIFY